MCPSYSDYSNTFCVVRVSEIDLFLWFVMDYADRYLKDY